MNIEITVPCRVTMRVETDADVSAEAVAKWLNENAAKTLTSVENAVCYANERRIGYLDDDFDVWLIPDDMTVSARVNSTLGVETFEWQVAP